MEQREAIQHRSVLSPLRYPGGKRRLVPFVAATLEVNAHKPDLFIEPFAGGASVAIELLATNKVTRIGLAELDPGVASFWEAVFFDTEWLCEQVRTIEVTLANWKLLKYGTPITVRDHALACLFLNRTSFNGTLHATAGPIGGHAQASAYKIDCRFPRERLVRRIQNCAALAGRVAFVKNAAALDVIAEARREHSDESLFFYFDPPFWNKADKLYRYSFDPSDHKRFASALRYMHEPYLLSYDCAPDVDHLYKNHGARIDRVELLYSASQRTAEHELVITNLEQLPNDTRLWKTNAEWKRARRRRAAIHLTR